eukprot:2427160-Prymnesium_polylepis.1
MRDCEHRVVGERVIRAVSLEVLASARERRARILIVVCGPQIIAVIVSFPVAEGSVAQRVRAMTIRWHGGGQCTLAR